MFWTVFERFGSICVMALVLTYFRVLAQRTHRQRLQTEARRLRCALSVCLQGLHGLYENDLLVLRRGGLRLISGRSQIALLRIQLGRLISLEEREIEAVLAACIATERAETAMAVAGKAMGVAAFKLPDHFTGTGALKTALTQACSLMVAAEEILVANTAGKFPAAEVAKGTPPDESKHPPLVGPIPAG